MGAGALCALALAFTLSVDSLRLQARVNRDVRAERAQPQPDPAGRLGRELTGNRCITIMAGVVCALAAAYGGASSSHVLMYNYNDNANSNNQHGGGNVVVSSSAINGRIYAGAGALRVEDVFLPDQDVMDSVETVVPPSDALKSRDVPSQRPVTVPITLSESSLKSEAAGPAKNTARLTVLRNTGDPISFQDVLRVELAPVLRDLQRGVVKMFEDQKKWRATDDALATKKSAYTPNDSTSTTSQANEEHSTYIVHDEGHLSASRILSLQGDHNHNHLLLVDKLEELLLSSKYGTTALSKFYDMHPELMLLPLRALRHTEVVKARPEAFAQRLPGRDRRAIDLDGDKDFKDAAYFSRAAEKGVKSVWGPRADQVDGDLSSLGMFAFDIQFPAKDVEHLVHPEELEAIRAKALSMANFDTRGPYAVDLNERVYIGLDKLTRLSPTQKTLVNLLRAKFLSAEKTAQNYYLNVLKFRSDQGLKATYQDVFSMLIELIVFFDLDFVAVRPVGENSHFLPIEEVHQKRERWDLALVSACHAVTDDPLVQAQECPMNPEFLQLLKDAV